MNTHLNPSSIIAPSTITVPPAAASGRNLRGRSFFAYLATVDINETRKELNRILGPVHAPIPAIPLTTFVAHDILGFGYTASPVKEGGRAGHKIDVLFEDEEDPRTILLSFLDFEDVSADDAEAAPKPEGGVRRGRARVAEGAGFRRSIPLFGEACRNVVECKNRVPQGGVRGKLSEKI